MKPSTSKVSVAPISEEPSADYVNNNLPNPDDEPFVSDMRNYQAGEELHREQSQLAREWYAIALPEMIDANREGTAELFTRFTKDEERKKAEMQKNKEAVATSRQSGDSRKRRNDVIAQCDEQEWKRQPHQQQWMAQSPMQHGFQMQQYPHHVQQQQYMQMQMAVQQQQHHGIQMHPNNPMPSTSTADSARSVHTPASIHQQSPIEGRNGNRMALSGSGMNTSSPTTGLDQQTDENTLAVPEEDWFEKLAVTPADGMVNGVAQQLPPPIRQLPTPQPQQQQNQEKMQRMEHQRHQKLLQQAQLAQLSQQRHQQQQMILQQQQMIGGFQLHAQQQAAYMQAQRMHQKRMQLHHQQQQLHHHQQQQQHDQNGGMGYGMPNGYPPQMMQPKKP